MGADQNSYSVDASEQVQSRVNQLSGQIASLIQQHETGVKALLADATVTGVTDTYRQIESKYSKAAQDVLNIIKLLTDTMKSNDESARTAIRRAQASVDAIPH